MCSHGAFNPVIVDIPYSYSFYPTSTPFSEVSNVQCNRTSKGYAIHPSFPAPHEAANRSSSTVLLHECNSPRHLRPRVDAVHGVHFKARVSAMISLPHCPLHHAHHLSPPGAPTTLALSIIFVIKPRSRSVNLNVLSRSVVRQH